MWLWEWSYPTHLYVHPGTPFSCVCVCVCVDKQFTDLVIYVSLSLHSGFERGQYSVALV